MAAALASTAGSCIGKRPSLLITLAMATAAAANANRPDLSLELEIADSSLSMPGEHKAAAGTSSDKKQAVARSAALGHGVMKDAMLHGRADEGPRMRVRAAATLQVLEGVERKRNTDKPDLFVSPVFEETKAKLLAIQDHESVNTNDKSGMETQNQNQGTASDPTSPPLKESAKTVVVVQQTIKEKEIEHRWAIWSVRYMLEEAQYAVDTVPAWLQGIMFVINMMIGSAVIYFLHTTKYRPEHGCATAFCFFCCWPCGILSICFPVDEATPTFKAEDREPEMRAEQQQEEEPPTFAHGVSEEPRISVARSMPEEPQASISNAMPEVQPAVMPTPEVESNKRESTVNVTLS